MLRVTTTTAIVLVDVGDVDRELWIVNDGSGLDLVCCSVLHARKLHVPSLLHLIATVPATPGQEREREEAAEQEKVARSRRR